ncbi:MAG: hypothetical protein M3R70_13170 [Actinomycetota bacterium]|nr:hypothetical protein [Actinomycetota bacterium]
MADPVEKAKDVAGAAAHPVDTAKDLAEEAERGRSPRTPAIAITGVSLVVGAIVVIVLVIAFVVYFAFGGR